MLAISVSSIAHLALMQTVIPKKAPATPAAQPATLGKRQMHAESPAAQPKVPKESLKSPAPPTIVPFVRVDAESPPPESKKRKSTPLEEQEDAEAVHFSFHLIFV